jgi:RNA processing factor Prp31
MLGPEIMAVHKTARDGFIQRFPELESIILVPGDYCKAVLAIGNNDQVDNLA